MLKSKTGGTIKMNGAIVPQIGCGSHKPQRFIYSSSTGLQ